MIEYPSLRGPTTLRPERDYTQQLEQLREASHEFLRCWGSTPRFDDLPSVRTEAVLRALRPLLKAAADVRELDDDALAARTTTGRRQSSKRAPQKDLESITPAVEAAVGIRHEELATLMRLDSLKGLGPQRFKILFEANVEPDVVLDRPESLPLPGRLGASIRRQIEDASEGDLELARDRAARQIAIAHQNGGHILTYWSKHYPRNLFRSNNPIPILYARGNFDILLNRRTVAFVGSRQISDKYALLHREFAKVASRSGWAVVSGFAQGADTIGHLAALECKGSTICVMPSGLDRPFPPENLTLWHELLESESAVMISEFPFGTGSNRLNLQKRNKTIVAASLGVVISQTSVKGGAMNAFRAAVEQRKPVATFEPSSSEAEDTGGNYVIAQERKIPTTQFALHQSPVRWKQWLEQLYSWI